MASEKDKVASEQQGQVAELEQENELLLLQLHHVQEELEHYFLKYQELENRSSNTVSNEVGIKQLELVELYELDGYRELKWVARGLQQSGRKLESLHFKLASHGGVPSLEVRPANDTEHAAFIWPEAMRDEHGDRLLIQPGGDAVAQQALRALSSADWALVNSLVDLVLAELMGQSLAVFNAQASLDRSQWLRLAAELQQSLRTMPSHVRFDSVQVREVYEVAGYEHLWLELVNLEAAERYYEQYHFKLVLKDMDVDGRPSTVALALRDLNDGTAPLYVWPPEAHDEFGSLLSVEWDSVSGEAIAGWDSLWAGDKAFIKRLLASLPEQLVYIAEKGMDTGKRSVGDWRQLLDPILSMQNREDTRSSDVPMPDDNQHGTAITWKRVELTESYREGRYAHLGLRVVDLNADGVHWPEYEFKLFARKLDEDLEEAWPGLELRMMKNGLAPLTEWPPVNVLQDEYGAYVLADKDYAAKEFGYSDQHLISQLMVNLPAWLKSIQAEQGDADPDWEVWQSLLERLLTENSDENL